MCSTEIFRHFIPSCSPLGEYSVFYHLSYPGFLCKDGICNAVWDLSISIFCEKKAADLKLNSADDDQTFPSILRIKHFLNFQLAVHR
ncbi:hypothetical protein I7I48_04130 [Histoplasma ohiense]|nr:hypothetical protein I7I48_04130 [Histoplasma ohiense (nom. inval.)]